MASRGWNVTEKLATRAGSALFWKGAQLVGTKVIFLVRILVLARLLSPDDFGLFAISLVAIDFLLRVTNTGMAPALVQAEEPGKGHFEAAWSLGLLRALAIGAVVVAGAPIIARLFEEPRAVDLLRILAMRPLLEATASIRVVELVRELRFRTLAVIHLSEAVVNTVVSVVLAGPLGVWALVAGPIAGAASYSILSYALIPFRPRLRLPRAALGGLVRYGRWVFLTGVIAVTSQSVLKLVIARELGAVELGLYFLAAKLAFLPGEAGEVVGSVAFPLHAGIQRDLEKSKRAFRGVLRGMMAVTIPTCVILIAVAPSLVSELLGPRWEGTATLIRVLACVPVIGLVGDATVPLLKGVGRPDRVAALEFVQSSLLITLAWWLTTTYGVIGAAVAWLPASAASQLLCAWFARNVLGRPFAGLGRPTMAIGSASLAGAGVAWLVGTAGGVLVLGTGVLLAAVAALGVLLILDDRWRLGIVADLVRVYPRLGGVLRAIRSTEGARS